MSDSRLVWSDEEGDLRKKKDADRPDLPVDVSKLELKLRRLTAGKGRTVIDITGLPQNKKWNADLATQLKKKLGIGGTFKDGRIELHQDSVEKVGELLTARNIKWKKTGG